MSETITTALNIVMEPKESLLPPLRQRLNLDRAELRPLADNLLAVGFLQPIRCTRDKRIVTGFRRWSAAMIEESITHVPVLYEDAELSAASERIHRICENSYRLDVSIGDKCEEIEGVMREQPGLTQKSIARLMNVDSSTVTRILSYRKCIAGVQAVADELGIKLMYDFSKESPGRQAELLADWQGHKRPDGAADAGNGNGTVQASAEAAKPVAASNGNGHAAASFKPKFAKQTFPLPSGYVVQLTGDELSLEDAIRELTALLSAMRKAEKDGLDAKTFQAMCRDKANAAS